jgi:hypothetical protein
MSTNEVQNLDSTVTLAAATFVLADPTKWDERDNREVPNGFETVYQRNDADPEYPDTIRIGVYSNTKSGSEAGYNVSIRRDYWNKYTDDNSEVHYEANVFTMVFQTKRQPMLGVSDLMVSLIMNTVALTIFGNASSGAPDFDGITRLSRGNTNLDIDNLTVS